MSILEPFCHASLHWTYGLTRGHPESTHHCQGPTVLWVHFFANTIPDFYYSSEIRCLKKIYHTDLFLWIYIHNLKISLNQFTQLDLSYLNALHVPLNHFFRKIHSVMFLLLLACFAYIPLQPLSVYLSAPVPGEVKDVWHVNGQTFFAFHIITPWV